MLKSKSLRIIIDTNLWISLVISKRLNRLDGLLYSRRVRILLSLELIEEIQETIKKPKLKKYFLANSIEEMLLIFDPFVELVKVKSVVQACRDPKDNFLLALAKDGKADFLLTGDNDLLEVIKFGKTEIVTMTEFLKNNL